MLPLPPALRGRDVILAEAEARLGRGAPILTLWGPGGIGKTSLALALLHRAKVDGVFAALAADRSATDVLRTIGSSLGAPITRTRSVADGVRRIGDLLASRKNIVVVLDNAETIIEALADLVVKLRAFAPDARFVVTSREPLGIAAEEILEVPPLDGAFATELLVERARAVRADFEEPATVIADLVSRTEGIPLAIELCAARLDVLSARELAERLAKSLDVLKTPRRDVDERHRTLFASLALSHRLLDAAEQRALAGVAVFASDFDLAAAEAVAGDLDVIEALVRKSLVRRRTDAAGKARLSLQPAVLAFVRERAGGADHAAETRHATHFAARARTLAQKIDGSDGAAAVTELARLEPELVAVVERAATEDATEALIALQALSVVRGPIATFVERARRFHAAREASFTASQRGRVETALGASLLSLGLLEEARAILEHATTCLDGSDLARALQRLGEIAHEQSDYAYAHDAFTRAIANAREDPAIIGLCLSSIGAAEHVQGDLGRAAAHYAKARELLHAGDHLRGEARALSRLGFLATDEGNTNGARAAFAESLAICSRLGDERLAAYATAYVGNTLRAEGELESALAHYDDAIAVMRLTGDRLYEAVFRMDRAIARLLDAEATQALAELDAATAIVKDTGDRHLAALIAGYRVTGLALSGAHEAARALAKTARAEAFSVNLQCLELHAQTARVLAGEDDADGRALLAQAAPRAEHVRLARTMLQRALDGARPPENALVVERTGVRLPGGTFVALEGRAALHAVLNRLVDLRLARKGEGASAETLLAAGWPGERVQKEAGAIRVRVTIAQLRKLGLASVLDRAPNGYRLDPDTPIVDRRRI